MASPTKTTPLEGVPAGGLRSFYHLLSNTLLASIINFTVWFAITFYAYLETQSVFVTGVIAGIYVVFTAFTGIWFGSLVDHHRKKQIMMWSSLVSLVFYIAAFAIYQLADQTTFKDPASVSLWVLIGVVMFGVLVGNIRNIALPTTVTILIPEGRRDKANGLVGSTMGIAMLVTSFISGVLVGWGGMFYVLILAILATLFALAHLGVITVPEKKIVHTDAAPKKVDLKGTWKIVVGIPGLVALILFTTFNNFLGGGFMALMDAYGLSLMSVQMWGFLWGVVSLGFIAGGLVIAKEGLGKNPLKTMLLANVVLWVISALFTIQPWIWLLGVGIFVYMCLMPIVEATEQTILQKVVPHERQGRVFGFAQSVEQAASPLTAFLIGPLTQLFFIPFMTDGAGAQAIGSWFGTGANRGIALVFVIAGVIGLIVTLLALGSKYYRQLSAQYLTK
jgi:MFS transporter, DHA3 family, multidrug efflux protein